jgi:hypothetical protein
MPIGLRRSVTALLEVHHLFLATGPRAQELPGVLPHSGMHGLERR